MRPVPTFCCPSCKQVSVANRDADGFPVCPHCHSDQVRSQGSDLYSPTVKRLAREFGEGRFDPKSSK